MEDATLNVYCWCHNSNLPSTSRIQHTLNLFWTCRNCLPYERASLMFRGAISIKAVGVWIVLLMQQLSTRSDRYLSPRLALDETEKEALQHRG
jgi:hypothetical protein